MATSSGKYKGYTLKELEKQILWETGQVVGVTVSYAKFPRWLIRQRLTERQNSIAIASQCLKKYCLIPMVDGRRTYRLPANCMDGGVISAKFYDSTTSYSDLDIYDEKWLDENREGWRTDAEGDPEIIFPGPSYGNTQTVSFYPVPSTSGSSYADALGTGIYLGTDLPAASMNLEGTTDSAGDSTTLNDSTSDFTQFGLVAGMAVRNITDGSVAKLLTIADHQLVMESALTGGTDNTFASGDSYMILAGEYMVVTSSTKEDRYLFGTQIGILDGITIPADHVLIQYVPYPMAFPFDPDVADASQGWEDMYPEVPRAYHHGMAMGVVADMLRTFNENTAEFKRAEAYEQAFNSVLGNSLGKKFSRPFDDPRASFFPSRRRR